jgi:hypothetical protein
MHRLTAVLVPLLLLGLFALPGLAGGPVVHELAGSETFAKGRFEALSLASDGILRPGPAFDAKPLDVPTAWAATTSGEDFWVGTGNQALLLRIRPDGEIERIGTGDGLMVTAVAPRPDGGVIAALFPGGRIVRVDAKGDLSTFATLPVEYVWAMVPDGRGGVTAATGMPGALYAVDAFGAVERLAEVDDEHARCLVRGDGAFLVGTAPKGLVLSVKGPDVSVVRDLAAKEVVGILPVGDGGLLVAANADQAGGNAQTLSTLLKQLVQPPETRPGQEPRPRAALQDGSVVWLEPSGAVTTLWSQEKVAVLGLARDGQGAVAGTYPSGRLVRVQPGHPSALIADLDEAEASVVVGGVEGIDAVVTSNPAVLHRRRVATSAGTWTSAPVDAGAAARWGRVRLSGTGVKTLSFRSGETEEPDEAWRPWRAAVGFDGTEGDTGASSRFLQLRVTLEGEDAELRSLTVVAAAPNRAPVISELTAAKKGNGGADAAGASWVVTWKAEDADGDRLEVNLHAQREGSPRWIPLIENEVLEKAEANWDTSGLPDGTYRLRLVLSDAPDTPPERARDATHFTGPLRVDNTAPHVTVRARVAGDRLLVEGEAVDQPGGRIAAVRVSVDGGPWRVMSAADGLMDEARERFEASLASPGTGPHDLVVQARDAEGNVGAGATVVQIR